MEREEIQAENPGGVRKQPAARMGNERAAEGDCAPLIPDIRKPLPDRNVTAVLSFVSGLSALSLAVVGFLAAGESPHWLARVLEYSPAGTGTASLLAVTAFLLAVFGIIEAVCYSTVRGLPWAVGGLAISGLTICTVLATWGELSTEWQ